MFHAKMSTLHGDKYEKQLGKGWIYLAKLVGVIEVKPRRLGVGDSRAGIPAWLLSEACWQVAEPLWVFVFLLVKGIIEISTLQGCCELWELEKMTHVKQPHVISPSCHPSSWLWMHERASPARIPAQAHCGSGRGVMPFWHPEDNRTSCPQQEHWHRIFIAGSGDGNQWAETTARAE